MSRASATDCHSPAALLSCTAVGCAEAFPQTTGRAVRLCGFHKMAESFPCAVDGGELKRYCKQCSRPHRLSRFSGNNRSCEQRLSRKRERRTRREENGRLREASTGSPSDDNSGDRETRRSRGGPASAADTSRLPEKRRKSSAAPQFFEQVWRDAAPRANACWPPFDLHLFEQDAIPCLDEQAGQPVRQPLASAERPRANSTANSSCGWFDVNDLTVPSASANITTSDSVDNSPSAVELYRNPPTEDDLWIKMARTACAGQEAMRLLHSWESTRWENPFYLHAGPISSTLATTQPPNFNMSLMQQSPLFTYVSPDADPTSGVAPTIQGRLFW